MSRHPFRGLLFHEGFSISIFFSIEGIIVYLMNVGACFCNIVGKRRIGRLLELAGNDESKGCFSLIGISQSATTSSAYR